MFRVRKNGIREREMRIDRREFLVRTLIAGGVIGTVASDDSGSKRNEREGMRYRLLGKTGMNVSMVGMGAMQCADPAVVRYAVSLGINYVDTADCYMGGQNEKIVGRALDGIRDRVFLATKVHIATEKRMIESIEHSLRSLRTDRVDLMQLHGLSSKEQVLDERAKNVLSRMKREGKVGFAGVTTHSNQVRVIEAVIEDNFYDTVLVAYNFRSPQILTDIIGRAGAARIGIIAMKTQNGGYRGIPFPGLTPHQAALRYVLDSPGVVTSIPGMYTKSMIDENVAVTRVRQNLLSDLLLDSHREDLIGKACSFCSRCVDECAHREGGIDAVRVGMYLTGYGDRELAGQEAKSESVRRSLLRCSGCENCTVSCPEGMDIPEVARYTLKILARKDSV